VKILGKVWKVKKYKEFSTTTSPGLLVDTVSWQNSIFVVELQGFCVCVCARARVCGGRGGGAQSPESKLGSHNPLFSAVDKFTCRIVSLR